MKEESEIFELENQLFSAMRSGDVAILDSLISDQLQFVTLGGTVLRKEDDLSAHRSGIFKIKKLEPSEHVVKVFDNVATVTVLIKLEAAYGDQPIVGNFRFGRTWYRTDNSWKIITGLLTKVSE